ncbi:MAG: aldo/keto reductase [Gammaproteobacteria bacterium]|nr:aldo/keto reductase [Gammaproteobacteria bacterium]
MKYTNLGRSELNVSKICLGTMTFGQQNSEAEGHQMLDYAFEQGINFVDTAEMYPVPPKPETVFSTEKIVGSWLKKQDRDKVILATKVTGGGRNMNWVRDSGLNFDKKNIRAAIEGSLKRLQTDYIDLYQLHWPNRNTPMFGEYRYEPDQERDSIAPKETLEVLAELVDEGKIRAIGLSNEWPWGVMQFLNAANEFDLPRVVTMQNAYSLLNRTYETALLEMCHREDISLIPYSPLGFGLLSAKYQMDPNARGRVNDFDGFAQRYDKPQVPLAIAAYADLAKQFDLSPAQFALAFVYSRWFCASTIIGTTSMAQLRENIGAFNVQWTDEMEQATQALHLTYFNPAP